MLVRKLIHFLVRNSAIQSIAMLALLAACASATELLSNKVEFEPMHELPEEWGSFSDAVDVSGNCPFVAGMYSAIADIVEYQNGKSVVKTGNEWDCFSLFIGPLDANGTDTDEAGNINRISLSQPDSRSLVLRAPVSEGQSQVTYRLTIGPGKLECRNGFFELPREVANYMAEGSALNYQSMRRFSTLKDGSLVYYEQFGNLTAAPGRKTSFTHRYYRFRRVLSW
jgi:hypothetical protein